MRKLVVNEKFEGKSLNSFVSFSFPKLKQNMFFKALRQKDIKVNGQRVKENVVVHSGDMLEIYISDELLLGKTIHLKVVYEDENILAVDKPEGISVTEEAGSTTIWLSKIVKEQFGNSVEPVHRLDRNTKGIVLFAKNKDAEKILLEKFKNHEIEKHYRAQVYGIPKEEHQVLKDYLFKDSKKNMVYISDISKKGYQEIITEYTVFSKNLKENTAILDVNLHTGRTHQIRAHLAFHGYPIIGDGKYGNSEINKKFGKKTQDLVSYRLIFKFKTNAGLLEYLNNVDINISI